MALAADRDLALFCGLNVMSKKGFLCEHSSGIAPAQGVLLSDARLG